MRLEGEVGKCVLVGGDSSAIELEKMDNAEVNLAHGIGVVINQSYNAVVVVSLDIEFFVNLALDGRVVGGLTKMVDASIDRIDVSSDPDGALGMQARLARSFPPSVMQHLPVMMENTVGDDLLVA